MKAFALCCFNPEAYGTFRVEKARFSKHAKNIGNLSFYFDDDYKFNFGNNNSINLGWILDLRKELKIPHTLKELIDDDSRLEEMSKMALNDPSTAGNPVSLKEQDFLDLYKKSFEGSLLI